MKNIVVLLVILVLLMGNIIQAHNFNEVSRANDKLINLCNEKDRTIEQLKNVEPEVVVISEGWR